MSDRKLLPGKFVWFEHVSTDAKKAQAFYGEVLGWTVQAFPMGAFTYEMIHAGGTMIGGYATPKSDAPAAALDRVRLGRGRRRGRQGRHRQRRQGRRGALRHPGRRPRGADRRPAGRGDLPVQQRRRRSPDTGRCPPAASSGTSCTPPTSPKALAFYEKVVGFSHRAMDMGPGGTYHIVSQGRRRARRRRPATCRPGVPPHWLPYVHRRRCRRRRSRAPRSTAARSPSAPRTSRASAASAGSWIRPARRSRS